MLERGHVSLFACLTFLANDKLSRCVAVCSLWHRSFPKVQADSFDFAIRELQGSATTARSSQATFQIPIQTYTGALSQHAALPPFQPTTSSCVTVMLAHAPLIRIRLQREAHAAPKSIPRQRNLNPSNKVLRFVAPTARLSTELALHEQLVPPGNTIPNELTPPGAAWRSAFHCSDKAPSVALPSPICHVALYEQLPVDQWKCALDFVQDGLPRRTLTIDCSSADCCESWRVDSEQIDIVDMMFVYA